jgi:serine protease inhibitor
VERVDFTNDIEDTRHKINKWIENETHGECDAVFLQICQFYVNTENCQL